MSLRGFSAFEARYLIFHFLAANRNTGVSYKIIMYFLLRFRAKMAKTAPKDVLVKKRIRDGLTEENMYLYFLQ